MSTPSNPRRYLCPAVTTRCCCVDLHPNLTRGDATQQELANKPPLQVAQATGT